LKIKPGNNNSNNFGCVYNSLAQPKIPYALLKTLFETPKTCEKYFTDKTFSNNVKRLIDEDHSKAAGWFLILLGNRGFKTDFIGKTAELIQEQIKNLINAGDYNTLKPVIKLLAKAYENRKLSLYYVTNAAEQLANTGKAELLKPLTKAHLNILTDTSIMAEETSQAGRALGKISEILIKEKKFEDLAEINKVLLERLNNKYLIIQMGESDCITAIAKGFAKEKMFEEIKPFTEAILKRIENKAYILEEITNLGTIGSILAENGRYEELKPILSTLAELSKYRYKNVRDIVTNCLACHIGPVLKAKGTEIKELAEVRKILCEMPKDPLYG